MADYAKIAVRATYSKNSDYSGPKIATSFGDYESTPDEAEYYIVDAETTGATITTSKYGSLTTVVVKNNDSTNQVTVAFQNAAAAAQSQVIAAGKFGVFPDVLASANITLTASGATVECEVYIQGT